MLRIVLGVFLILHGAVHLLWVGLARGWIPRDENIHWSGKSWLLTRTLGDQTTHTLGAGAFTLATLVFVIAGIGLLIGQKWYAGATIAAAVISIVTIVGLWDGQLVALQDKGILGILIDAGALVLALRFPDAVL